MRDADPYIALMASLPSSEKLFLAKQPPISRLKLDRRLRTMTPADRETLSRIEGALAWRSFSLDDADATVVTRAQAVYDTLESETLRGVMDDRLGLRTCMAGLRRRAAGKGPPTPRPRWGWGRYPVAIAANWREPAFGLDATFPALAEMDALIRSGDSVPLERLTLQTSWRSLNRHAGGHSFDLEAVVIYVLKWNIFNRWSRADAAGAARRFEAMAESGLATFSDPRLADEALAGAAP